MSSDTPAGKWLSAFLGPNTSGAPAADLSMLRAGDQDRERVAAVLTDALVDGRLTPLEHEERLSSTYAARTLGELAALTADLLPPESQPLRMGGAPVKALFRSESRGGRWVVPAQIPVTSLGGKVTMDLCEALLQSRRVVVQLAVVAGSVTLIVPEGVRIDPAPSARLGASFQNEVRRAPGAPADDPNAPVIELAGYVIAGKVVARSPKPPRRKFFRR